MTALIFGHDQAIARWVASQIKRVNPDGFGPCTAIGIATGTSPTDQLLAGIVYHDYQHWAQTVSISFAAASPRWATKETIRRLLHVPFEQYHCRKVWMAIPSDNPRAIRLNEGLGFKREATLRDHFAPKVHAIILSMLFHEWRATWGNPNGARPPKGLHNGKKGPGFPAPGAKSIPDGRGANGFQRPNGAKPSADEQRKPVWT